MPSLSASDAPDRQHSVRQSRLPLTYWFLATHLLTQSKTGISAMELKRQLGVSYNTAWMMKHKLLQAMKEEDDRHPIRG